jgi:SAM-dependent methyltransferase
MLATETGWGMTTKYDLEAYPYTVRPFSHPARIAALAQLYGFDAAPFHACRVLEIGGGDGINVINMAVAAPQSEFVNFDLSSVAIEAGRSMVADLGLSNMRMEAMDILQAGEDLGTFDYIIAHGVYAWVPPPVREALMGLIGHILAPRGIALVSYNSAPGCHIRSAIRDLVYRGTAAYDTAEDRIRVARELLTFHAKHWNPKIASQAVFLGEAERILNGRSSVLFHDELSDDWHPQFVSDVVAAARQNGLDYLGDSQLELVGPALFPDDFTSEAAPYAGEDFAALEQMRDYRDARAFRITLLCRDGHRLDRRFQPQRMDGLFLDGTFKPMDPSKTEGKPYGWAAANGIEICTSDARLDALCRRLNDAWPQAVPIDEVAKDHDMREAVAKLFSTGSLGCVSTPYALTATPGDRPRASRVARAQILRGAQSVSTLRHTQVRLEDEQSLAFLAALDGTRDRRALVALMKAHAAEGADVASLVATTIDDLATFGLMEA